MSGLVGVLPALVKQRASSSQITLEYGVRSALPLRLKETRESSTIEIFSEKNNNKGLEIINKQKLDLKLRNKTNIIKENIINYNDIIPSILGECTTLISSKTEKISQIEILDVGGNKGIEISKNSSIINGLEILFLKYNLLRFFRKRMDIVDYYKSKGMELKEAQRMAALIMSLLNDLNLEIVPARSRQEAASHDHSARISSERSDVGSETTESPRPRQIYAPSDVPISIPTTWAEAIAQVPNLVRWSDSKAATIIDHLRDEEAGYGRWTRRPPGLPRSTFFALQDEPAYRALYAYLAKDKATGERKSLPSDLFLPSRTEIAHSRVTDKEELKAARRLIKQAERERSYR